MSTDTKRYTACLDPEILSDLTQVEVFGGSYDYQVTDENGPDKPGSIGYTITVPEDKNAGSRSGQIFVMTSSWSESAGRGPQLDRQKVIAGTLDVPVIAIDMQGQGPNSSRMPKSLRKSMAQGDFTPVAKLIWNTATFASRYHGLNIKDKEAIVVGMSQGATVAGAMLEVAPEDQIISDVILWNTPSFSSPRERSWLDLGKAFLGSGTDFEYYAGLNPDWAYREGPKDLIRFARHFRGLLPEPVMGMAKARTHEGVSHAMTLRNYGKGITTLPRIHIVNGSEDDVSRRYDNDMAVDYLRRFTAAEVRPGVQTGEYHSVTNALAAVAQVAAEVALAQS